MEFGEIDLGSHEESADDAEELRSAAEHFLADATKGISAEEEEEEAVPAGWGAAEDEEEDEGGFDLPMMSFDAEPEAEEDDAEELPMMSLEEEDDDEAVELPTFDTGDEPEEEEAAELPTFGLGEDEAAATGAGAIEEAMEEAAAEAPPPPRPPPPPPAPAKKDEAKVPDGGYIDLGAMILGGGSSEKKTTRFKVAYEEPSGDEEADFAKMLSQFKEKVSENIEASDVRAHHDLGTAYKEMGLLEEAISAFQSALRASADHLPTYEIMGQTFIEMGQPDAAVRTLQRALKIKSGVEDEFVGIYYYLARAYEALDKRDSAVEFYDRVFSLDINFADVTERLRELR
jgi:tetratricopeptide (TPR) repeat protein